MKFFAQLGLIGISATMSCIGTVAVATQQALLVVAHELAQLAEDEPAAQQAPGWLEELNAVRDK